MRPPHALSLIALVLASVALACGLPRPAAASVPVCTATMTAISFGSVNVLPGAAVDTTGTLTIACTGLKKNDSERFCTDLASGADVSGTQRRMVLGGSSYLKFDLYKDSARSQQWGSYGTGFLG